MKAKQAHGHAKKHTGTKKHAAHTAKHHPAHQHAHHQPAKAQHHKTAHVKAQHPHHAKARGLSLADVQCCAADALAWSLRLAGWPVGDQDVLALYKLTADSPDAGAGILATLDAAYVFGLAGVKPVSFEAVSLDELAETEGPAGVGAWRRLVLKPQSGCHPPPGNPDITQLWPASTFRGPALVPSGGLPPVRPSMLLGVDLPGPHTVLTGPYGGWITWNHCHNPDDFPDAVIEEAWAVTWP